MVAGSGFGTSFLGIMRSITPTVGPEQRGELFSSVFVVSYLAFGLPAVAAGFAAPHLGLERTATVYGLAVSCCPAPRLWPGRSPPATETIRDRDHPRPRPFPTETSPD